MNKYFKNYYVDLQTHEADELVIKVSRHSGARNSSPLILLLDVLEINTHDSCEVENVSLDSSYTITRKSFKRKHLSYRRNELAIL